MRLQSRSDLAEIKSASAVHTKGFGIAVALVQIVEHGFFQHSNCSVTASSDTAFGHFGEESLHQVEPTSAGRRSNWASLGPTTGTPSPKSTSAAETQPSWLSVLTCSQGTPS